MNTTLNESNSPVLDIEVGNEVRDVNSENVGTVKAIRFSDENPATPEAEVATTGTSKEPQSSLVTEIAEAFTDVDDMPEELRRHLLNKGYIRIGRGFLRRDSFASMDQVATLVDKVVYLNIPKEELLSF